MRLKPFCILSIVVLFISSASFVRASPWALPEDPLLYHDLKVLADEGIVDLPVTTWPIPWPDIAQAIERVQRRSALPTRVRPSFNRITQALHRESQAGSGAFYLSAGAKTENSENTARIATTPRTTGELGIGTSWLGDALALGIESHFSYARDGQDVDWRLDNSYIGAVLGNWILSASLLPRQWGPGFDGSLLLSTQSRPLPSLTLERRQSTDGNALGFL